MLIQPNPSQRIPQAVAPLAPPSRAASGISASTPLESLSLNGGATWNAASRWGGLADAFLGNRTAPQGARQDSMANAIELAQQGVQAAQSAQELRRRATQIARTARERPYTETFLHDRARVVDSPTSTLAAMTLADFETRMRELKVDLSPTAPTGRLLQEMRTRQGGNGDPLQRETYAALARIGSEHGAQSLNTLSNTLSGYLRQPNPQLEVVTSGLRDVAIPAGIRQGSVGDCGAVGVQQLWASQHPETYVQALTKLASNRPHTFANGRQMPPFHASLPADRQGRSASGVIMADAIARYSHQNQGRDLVQQVARGASSAAETARDEALRRARQRGGILGGLVASGLERVQVPGQNGRPIYTVDDYDNRTQNGAANAPGELANVLSDITGRKYRFQTGDVSRHAAGEIGQGRPAIMLLPGSEFHWVSATAYDPANHGMQISSWGSQYRAQSGQIDELALGVLIPEGPAGAVPQAQRDVNLRRR